MKRMMLLRLVTVFGVVLLAGSAIAQEDVFNRDYNLGGGGGAGACLTCSMNGYGLQGSVSMQCASPGPGDLGHQVCWIETYPEASYCFVAGDECCVD